MSEKILNTIKSLSEDKEEGNGGWITGIVLVVLSLIAIAIYAFKAWKSGKKKAKLLHQKAVKEEKAAQERAKGKLAEEQKVIDDSAVKINKLENQITELKEEAKELEAERENNLNTIDKIKSWRDVDEKVK